MRVLTKEEIFGFQPRLVKKGVPVRFMDAGCSVDIVTGYRCSKGCNIMYQIFYWNLPRDVSKEVAALTGTKAVFSE